MNPCPFPCSYRLANCQCAPLPHSPTLPLIHIAVDPDLPLADQLAQLIQHQPDMALHNPTPSNPHPSVYPHLFLTAAHKISRFRTLAQIKRQRPWLTLLVFTRHASHPWAQALSASGALLLLSDPSDHQTLLQTIRSAFPCQVKATRPDNTHQDHLLARLSQRERQILALTASGSSLKQIALQLHLAFGTVTRHRSNLMNKLDLHDKVALTHFAIRHGLTEL